MTIACLKLRSEEKDACFQLKTAAEQASDKIAEQQAKVAARVSPAPTHAGVEDLDHEVSPVDENIEDV